MGPRFYLRRHSASARRLLDCVSRRVSSSFPPPRFSSLSLDYQVAPPSAGCFPSKEYNFLSCPLSQAAAVSLLPKQLPSPLSIQAPRADMTFHPHCLLSARPLYPGIFKEPPSPLPPIPLRRKEPPSLSSRRLSPPPIWERDPYAAPCPVLLWGVYVLFLCKHGKERKDCSFRGSDVPGVSALSALLSVWTSV